MSVVWNDVAGLGRDLDQVRRRLQFRLLSSPLNPWRIPVLQAREFSGKRIIVIGPASTVAEDLRGVDVDAHDVVVRMNNGIALAKSFEDGRLGTRTDILFHNLNETGARNAGEIPPELLQAHGVKACVFPHWTPDGTKRRLRAKLRQLRGAPGIELKVPPARFCETVRRALDGLPPTVGASAVLFFASCELRELAVHGFTFFETPYVAGYNDDVRTADDARAWVADSPVRHDPAREKQLIRSRLAEAEQRGVRLSLGRGVRKHLYA